MGNNHSSSTGLRGRRPTGHFEFSRSELDERSKPSGLYQSCAWDYRTVRRLIGDGKLAARLKGKDDRINGTEQECPICFLQYDEINMLKCCKANICTECYLQVQEPRSRTSLCPFCNFPNMSVVVAKKLQQEDVKKRDEEEQKMIEATIRARANSESKMNKSSSHPSSDGKGDDGKEGAVEDDNSHHGGGECFGSRLNEEMKRTRSRTMSAEHDLSSGKNTNDLITLTPNERRELEDQMRSQLSHPLMAEMQRNAELESQRHLLEHAQQRRDRIQSSRDQLERFIERARIREHGLDLFASSHRDYDEEDDMLEPGGVDEHGRPTFDDFYLLEAALYLSAREDSIRRRASNRQARRRNRSDTTLLRALLGRENSRRNRSNNSGDNDNTSNGENNDDNNNSSNGNDENGDNGENDRNNNRDNGNDRNTLTASDILLAGLSEANQLEMAIQMSLREAEEHERRQQEQGNEEGENGAETRVEETTAANSTIEEQVNNEEENNGTEENTSSQMEESVNAEQEETSNVTDAPVHVPPSS